MMTPDPTLDRRHFLMSSLFAAITSLAAGRAAWADVVVGPGQLPAPTRLFLASFCDTVLPVTDTPGALIAKVPDFIERIVLRASTPEALGAFIASTDDLRAMLDQRGGQTFAAASLPARTRTLSAVDDQAMVRRPDCRVTAITAGERSEIGTYLLLKAITVWGFYTSEPGGSQDLRFELVPGGYAPDVPLSPDWRNYCNETVLGNAYHA